MIIKGEPVEGPLRGAILMQVKHLRDLLVRAHAGEDPDLLMAEEYANAVHEPIEEYVERVKRERP